ncbi:hypothetical protein GW17_00029286 [Ensete ventricosum]|nr:hypothetical protein GW17_00029286 [Ensete ventricosum]
MKPSPPAVTSSSSSLGRLRCFFHCAHGRRLTASQSHAHTRVAGEGGHRSPPGLPHPRGDTPVLSLRAPPGRVLALYGPIASVRVREGLGSAAGPSSGEDPSGYRFGPVRTTTRLNPYPGWA